MKFGVNRSGASQFVLAFVCAALPLCAAAGLQLDYKLSAPQQPGTVWRSPKALTFAQSPAPPGVTAPMTLAALTDLALRNNPATREVWQAANAQAAALGMAEAEYYPMLDLNVALARSKSSSGSTTSTAAQTRLSPSVSLSYVLFDFGARAANKQSASYSLLAANLNQNRTLQAVVLRVEQTYYQLLAARQTVVAGEQTLKNVQISADVANARRKAGLATIGDVYQANTLLAQSRLALRRAQGEADKFKGALCNAVGLPVETPLPLAEAQLPAQEVRLTVEEYLSKAKQTRPDLGAAEAQARAALAGAQATAAQGRPTLSLAASGGRTFNNFDSEKFGNGSNNASIGLNFSVPLFDGFKTTHSVKLAEAQAAQLDATRERVAQQVELDVWNAYFDLDTAQAAIESAHAYLRSAKQAREVAHARYQAGVGNIPELMTAQANEANARMEVIQAEMGWYASLSQLNFAIGVFSSDLENK